MLSFKVSRDGNYTNSKLIKLFYSFCFLFLIISNHLYSQESFSNQKLLLSKNLKTENPLEFQDDKFDSLVANPNRDYSYWFNFGIGGGYYGTKFYTSLSYVKKKLWFSFRYYFANEQQDEYDFETLKIPNKSCHELGLLTGLMFRNKNVAFGFAGGVAYLSAVDRGNYLGEVYYEQINYSGISFPLEAKFRLSINGVVGGGFSVICNINSHKTFFGAVLELTFGLL